MVTIEASKFNIQNAEGQYLCPVCGFEGFSSRPTYSDEFGGMIGMAICPCCLWEPGFDDHPLVSAQAKITIFHSVKSYRKRWNREWLGRKNLCPPDWDPEKQLFALYEIAPYVR